MKLLLVDNAHIFKDLSDGQYYSESIYDCKFFQRYLNVFDEVHFLAKVKLVSEINTEKYIKLACNKVKIIEFPWYKGIIQAIMRFPILLYKAHLAHRGIDIAIYRSFQIESMIAHLAKSRNVKYAMEVVNDPEQFNGRVISMISSCYMKHMIKNAVGVSFVTHRYLQSKYLPVHFSKSVFISSYSSIQLSDKDFSFYQVTAIQSPVKLIHICNSINDDSKGSTDAIRILHEVIDRGIDAILTIVGSGSFVSKLQLLAEKLSLSEKINFVPRIAAKGALFNIMSDNNFLVYPTKSEGLPRIIIESMAIGTLCLASGIAGIPELLEPLNCFAVGDIKGYVDRIIYYIDNSVDYTRTIERNVIIARKYHEEILTPIRSDFYNKIAEHSGDKE